MKTMARLCITDGSAIVIGRADDGRSVPISITLERGGANMVMTDDQFEALKESMAMMYLREHPHEDHAVLSVGMFDFECAADEDAPQENKDRLAIAQTMDAEEWDYLAALMREDLHNPDTWDYALTHAADYIQRLRGGTDGPL